jgi:hypothetical protein
VISLEVVSEQVEQVLLVYEVVMATPISSEAQVDMYCAMHFFALSSR